MRSLFDSLAVRIGAVFLIGGIAFQVALLIIVFWPGGPARPVFLLPSPEQALAMASALEKAPPALRPDIVRALNSDALIVRIKPSGEIPDDGAPLKNSARLERLFARYAKGLDGRAFRVQVRAGGQVNTFSANDIGAAAPVRLLLSLRTGETLVLERTRAPALRRLMNRGLLIGTVGLVILAFVLGIALRQTAHPIKRLSQASRQLAGNLDTPDLSLNGPSEIRELSAAFNEMKHTIRSLIDDRTRMLAAIAHDFRTYLTRLRLRIEFIDDKDQRTRAITDIEEMNNLLDDTLTFAREISISGAPKTRSVEIVAEISNLTATRQESGHAVEFSDRPETPIIAACAPLALRRMLDNLVDNALRYAGSARLSVWSESAFVMVAVEDSGPGVPDEALSRLTTPFERLETSRARHTGGVGLGLSIVKALAESQGGGVSIQNRPEGGLRVTLRLPANSTD
ncbi:hypothetical protein ABENE_20025 [Asticcacaulis benevestitus DSM 16100 = ATCC BAA-896]|uniref:histidine kinase n=2 Tax=Asticcacaulis TaxID=76890 RepID=V4NPN7_9CAUL|nr:hypothetical protein ABENE_20025 [Asticcacaulis benevestitus DSM 16100 = ATCC BAA-896]